MIEEPRQPVTDVNLNTIRDVLNRHRISYQWSADEIATYFPDGFTPPTPQDIDDSITALLMEVARRRQREVEHV